MWGSKTAIDVEKIRGAGFFGEEQEEAEKIDGPKYGQKKRLRKGLKMQKINSRDVERGGSKRQQTSAEEGQMRACMNVSCVLAARAAAVLPQ